jgi:hypothetical protein
MLEQVPTLADGEFPDVANPGRNEDIEAFWKSHGMNP